MNKTHKEVVRLYYPKSTARFDYNLEDCWCEIYDNCDEDGLADGNQLGYGKFEEDAWKNVYKQIKTAKHNEVKNALNKVLNSIELTDTDKKLLDVLASVFNQQVPSCACLHCYIEREYFNILTEYFN